MIIWGVLLWVGFGLVTGYLAEQRGRSWGKGVLWGLLLGPIALFVAGTLPVKEWNLPVVAGESKRCRFCQSRISANAGACAQCGQADP